jgi:hypothetical protein
MSKDEFEAIESVITFFGEKIKEPCDATNAAQLEERIFWLNNFNQYHKFYMRAYREFHGLKERDKLGG